VQFVTVSEVPQATLAVCRRNVSCGPFSSHPSLIDINITGPTSFIPTSLVLRKAGSYNVYLVVTVDVGKGVRLDVSVMASVQVIDPIPPVTNTKLYISIVGGVSKAERATAAVASEKVIQRDLRSENSDLSSNRIKYALDELSKVPATLSLSSGYVTEAIDAHLLARPKQMIQQLLEAQTQAQAQALANQQAQQENQLKAQQDMQTALLQCVSSNGDQGRSQLRDTERRVEGLSMPAYHGHLNESIGLYIHRVKTFFAAKNL
ncbi:hypothetical protein DYB26_011364, partial [Aphanomyces astaci]